VIAAALRRGIAVPAIAGTVDLRARLVAGILAKLTKAALQAIQ